MQSIEQKEKRMIRNEQNLQDLWCNIKKNNVLIIGVPEGVENEKVIESLFKEIMTEKFPNLGRDLAILVYESNRPPQNFNPKYNLQDI